MEDLNPAIPHRFDVRKFPTIRSSPSTSGSSGRRAGCHQHAEGSVAATTVGVIPALSAPMSGMVPVALVAVAVFTAVGPVMAVRPVSVTSLVVSTTARSMTTVVVMIPSLGGNGSHHGKPANQG